MSHQPQRIARHAAAAVAVAALAASTALAQPPDVVERAVAAQQAVQGSPIVSPDAVDRAARARQALENHPIVSPDARDRAAGRLGPGSTDAVEITVHRPGGFDWSDAGIGAAAGAGLILLLVGTSLLVRVGRTKPRPT